MNFRKLRSLRDFGAQHDHNHDYVPKLRTLRARNNADRSLRHLLQMHRMRGHTPAEARRLLRILLVCGRSVPIAAIENIAMIRH